MNRKTIPRNTETEVLNKCNRRCAFCAHFEYDWGTKDGQIVHIDRNRSNIAEENLAYLCLPHHDKYDSKPSQTRRLQPQELRDAKQAINRKTVTLMIKALNEGGKLLWIAPSGGRDRPSAETGAWSPAPFDPAAVELMRQLTAKAKPAGHLYPLAMESGSMMPPPPATEKAVGERRLTNYVGVGIALGAKLDVEAIVAGIDEADRDARSAAVGAAAQKAVEGEYAGLLAAMAAGPGSWGGAYSQPWRKA